jgi:hypothetical protein
MGYESFLMDIGMYGNVLALNYKDFSVLATDHTWFKNLWELLWTFGVDATFSEGVQLLPGMVQAWVGHFVSSITLP